MTYLDHSDAGPAPQKFVPFVVPIVAVLTTMLGISLLPGMPRSAIFAHEWGTDALSFPLQAPIVRPVRLKKGERIHLHYLAQIRSGRLTVTLRHSGDPLSLLFSPPRRTFLSLTASGSGTALFEAPQTGFYLFLAHPQSTGGTASACKGVYADFIDVMLARKSNCPGYNMSYRLTLL